MLNLPRALRNCAGPLGFLVVGVSACDSGSGPDQSAMVSDSAGIRLARNSGPDKSLPISEALRVGVIDGDPNLIFDQIRTLAVDSLGGVWVSDSHESIRHYGPDGEYLGHVGGRGQGPGEAARGYGDVFVGPGTVLSNTYDGTIQLFSASGTFLGSREARLEPGKYLLPLGPRGDEWNLRIRDIPSSEADLVRQMWIVGRGTVPGTEFDSILSLPGGYQAAAGTGGWSNGSFFYGTPDVRGDSQGRIYHSHSLQYRIEVYDAGGNLIQVVSRDSPPTPTPSDLEEEVREVARNGWRDLMMGGAPPRERDVEETTRKALPDSIPDHLPYLEALFVSADGHIWAQRGDRHPSPAVRAVAQSFGFIRSAWPSEWRADLHFDLFSPDGTYRGSVVVPDTFIPMAVTPDRIFGSMRDELDVQYVVAFSVGQAIST